MNLPDSALDVLDMLADPHSLTLAEPPTVRDDPLQWAAPKPYAVQLAQLRSKTGLACGISWGKARLRSQPVILAASNLRFMMGSIATAEAAALSQCFDTAAREHLPVVWVARGSGARMHEGTYSLAAVARILGARNRLAESGMPLITVAADPLMAGCTICAMQGDVVLALEGARIGFAGAKVVEMFEKGPAPEGFQTAAYALATGQVDGVVPAGDLRATLETLVQTLGAPQASAAPMPAVASGAADGMVPPQPDPWQLVQRARGDDRPSTHEIIAAACDSFFELRGDRVNADDPAILAGLACLAGQPVVLIAHAATRTAEEKIRHNFAMAHPAGHRKALRLVRLAERLRLPIVTLVDTPGTCPDVRAESEGQAGIMGQLLCELLAARVPTISVILGQGNSGGAMVLAAADHVLMTDSSYYTVVSPEAVAAIVSKDPEKVAEAAAALRLTPADQLRAGLVDAIVPLDASPEKAGAALRAAISARLAAAVEGKRVRLAD